MRRKVMLMLFFSGVLIGGMLIAFTFANVTIENESPSQNFAPAAVPGPSPVLLFSMGFLGVSCVLINERKGKLPQPQKIHDF